MKTRRNLKVNTTGQNSILHDDDTGTYGGGEIIEKGEYHAATHSYYMTFGNGQRDCRANGGKIYSEGYPPESPIPFYNYQMSLPTGGLGPTGGTYLVLDGQLLLPSQLTSSLISSSPSQLTIFTSADTGGIDLRTYSGGSLGRLIFFNGVIYKTSTSSGACTMAGLAVIIT